MKRFVLTSLATALFGLSTAAVAGALPVVYNQVAPQPADPAEKEVAALFERWNAALATGNPDAVTALYAPQGVLLPTVSNRVRVGPEAIRDYFISFLQYDPKGTINLREIRMLDANTAVDSGVYTFALKREGRVDKVQARYTYVYEKTDGEWKIISHHSSAMPEAFDAAQLTTASR